MNFVTTRGLPRVTTAPIRVKTRSEIMLLRRNERPFFFVLKRNFSLTNRGNVKEKISIGIIGLVILRKRRVYLYFFDKTLLACFFRDVVFINDTQAFDLTRVNCKSVLDLRFLV